jgi:hypothetical protein
MIPASYMFKDIYHQHWEAAEPEPVQVRPEPRGGITIPLRDIIALVGRAVDTLRRRPAASATGESCP